jgi:hypothetical protein
MGTVIIQQEFINRIKASLQHDDEKHAKISACFAGKSDEKILHFMFHNFRGTPEDGEGLRLTSIGHEIMSQFFKAYKIGIDEGYRFTAQDMIFMEQKAKLPYYIGYAPPSKKGKRGPAMLAVYESMLGIMLRLNDGSITGLRTMGDHWGG